MFSLLNKNKNYLLVEVKYDILKKIKHVNNVLLFSPLNDIMFNKKKDEFLYPNKYNLYFKMYNIFSLFTKDLSIYDDRDKIDLNSNLFLNTDKSLLKDLIKYILDKDKHLIYTKGFGSFNEEDDNVFTYWFGIYSYIGLVFSTNFLSIASSNIKKILSILDYRKMTSYIKIIFENFEIFILKKNRDNRENTRAYCDIISNIKEIVLQCLSDNFKEINVDFYLSNRIKSFKDWASTYYLQSSLMFLYDKYKKDFVFLLDIRFGVSNYYEKNRNRSYNSELMYLRFNVIRFKDDIKLDIIFNFLPDSTYNNLILKIVDADGKTIEEKYKSAKNRKEYEKKFTYKITTKTKKSDYSIYLNNIDKSFENIYRESKIVMLNGLRLSEIIN